MPLPRQTVVLLESARQLIQEMPADAALLLTETNLDWDAVIQHLNGYRLLVAAQDPALTLKLKKQPGLTVIDIDPGPTPTQERMSLALLEAIQTEQIHSGAHVVVLYNGIEVGANPILFGQFACIDPLALDPLLLCLLQQRERGGYAFVGRSLQRFLSRAVIELQHL